MAPITVRSHARSNGGHKVGPYPERHGRRRAECAGRDRHPFSEGNLMLSGYGDKVTQRYGDSALNEVTGYQQRVTLTVHLMFLRSVSVALPLVTRIGWLQHGESSGKHFGNIAKGGAPSPGRAKARPTSPRKRGEVIETPIPAQ